MKLKTRLKLAWLELAVAAVILLAAVGLKLAMTPARTPMGLTLDLALPLIILLPLCFSAWSRLGKVKAQLKELGPEGAPSADLWTAPGAPGIVGLMVLLLALAVALAPPLLRG